MDKDTKFLAGKEYILDLQLLVPKEDADGVWAEDPDYITVHLNGVNCTKYNAWQGFWSGTENCEWGISDRWRAAAPATEPGDGVRVSGTATGWNNTDNAVYLLYPGSVSDEDIKAEWKTGTYAKASAYTAVKGGITANADGKRFDQAFHFDAVPAGEYKLAVFKPERYVPKIVPITVDSTALDLGQLKLWLYGDVNYDGWVLANDATQIVRRANGIGSVFDTGDTATKADRITAADLNADGTIRMNDAAQITRFVNGLGSVFNNFK